MAESRTRPKISKAHGTSRTRNAAPEETYQAPALSKGLEVLEFLSGKAEPFAISELARALGKSRNEIYRMVIVLERLGYLARSSTDQFSVTHKLFDVAMRTPPKRNLLAKALPVMEQLADKSFQSCHLVVASGPEMVVVARVESPDVLGFSVRVGYRRPLNQSAAGRVLFAYQEAAGRGALRALQSGKKEQELWDGIEREAEKILSMGFYLSPSSYVDAVTDIAAPVMAGESGQVLAALVMPYIGGRSARISLTEAASAVQQAAAAISAPLR